MYITELEIDNFKSFGKKTKIPFFEGFTVISGPNGSGKSNIIDSVLFCLALSSARGLRAEKLTDLINLNNGKNTAEVGITFSDGTKIRRRIKRTSNGYYSYNYLNDRLCKQKDIIDFLTKYGIKPEGYNVVMQGDITRIMEMSDAERRKIIDEIAGVAEFDKKKDQALGELEVVRERIEREELLLRELAIRLDELKSEREQALKYRQWQEKLDYFAGCRNAALLREREKELEAIETLIEDQEKELGRMGDAYEHQKQVIEEISGRMRTVDAEINEKSGTEYLHLLSRLEEAKGEIKLADQTITRLRKEKESNQEAIKKVYMDTKRAEGRIGEVAEAVRNLSVDRSNIAMEVASMRAELGIVEEKLKAESDQVVGARDELFSLMKAAEEQKSRRSELLHQQDMLIEKSRMRSSENERLKARLSQVESEGAEKKRQCDEYEGCISRLTGEKGVLEQSLSRTESTLFSHRSDLDHLRKEIKEREHDLMRLEAQQQATGGAGGRALEAILAMDGVYGTISQLGKVPPEYANALDIAAGGRLRYVVVENDRVAADAIRYLKDHRLGRVTFLPLNKLKAPDHPPVSGEGIIDYAVNLLDYDPLFDTAFRQIFAGTVVVDDLAHARKLIGRHRMVTLEGEVLERGGAMTGGSAQKKVAGFGVAVDDVVSKLRQVIFALETDASDLEQAIARIASESENLRRERSGLEEQIARYRMLMEEYSKQITVLVEEQRTIRESLDSMQQDVKGGGARLAAIEEELEGVSREISRLTAAIDELKKRLEDTGVPELTEQMERLQKEIGENERRLRNKDADIADAQRERQYFTKRLEELEQERERLTEKNRQADEEVRDCEGRIAASTALISDLEQQQRSFSQELENLRKMRESLNREMMDQEKKLVEMDVSSERVRLRIAALQEREQSLMQEVGTLRAEVGDTSTDLTLQEIEDGIAGAEREIRKIGAVNMLAIEEYERVEARVGERTEKKEVLSRERTSLIERIETFEQLKFDSFMEAFREIDTNFRLIFARLTSGSGRLVLDNEEDPFAGGMTFAVQPRDKKVHLLSALSGGEKSLTTLAFIFSIQQYMPAPFYALDEVDMFLDASNVERIATMIKDLSQNAQSIIVSLRKPTIERADRIVGVTLRPDKSTYVTGVKSNA